MKETLQDLTIRDELSDQANHLVFYIENNEKNAFLDSFDELHTYDQAVF